MPIASCGPPITRDRVAMSAVTPDGARHLSREGIPSPAERKSQIRTVASRVQNGARLCAQAACWRQVFTSLGPNPNKLVLAH